MNCSIIKHENEYYIGLPIASGYIENVNIEDEDFYNHVDKLYKQFGNSEINVNLVFKEGGIFDGKSIRISS